MPGRKAERRARPKPKVPRILPSDASAIFKRCEQILESSRELLGNLPGVGIAELFARLDDSVLQLAIQPNSWGERTRARLMSDLIPALCTTMTPGSALNIEDGSQALARRGLHDLEVADHRATASRELLPNCGVGNLIDAKHRNISLSVGLHRPFKSSPASATTFSDTTP